MVMPEVLEVEESPEHQTNGDQDQIKSSKLVHLALPFNRHRINCNTNSNKYTGQTNAYQQGNPGKRLAGQNSEYQDCQTQLRGIVEKLRQVVPSILSHPSNSTMAWLIGQ